MNIYPIVATHTYASHIGYRKIKYITSNTKNFKVYLQYIITGLIIQYLILEVYNMLFTDSI